MGQGYSASRLLNGVRIIYIKADIIGLLSV